MDAQSLPTISRERMVHVALFLLSATFLVAWNVLDVHMTAIDLVPVFALSGAFLGLSLPRIYRSWLVLLGLTLILAIVSAFFVSALSLQLSVGVQKSQVIPEMYKGHFSRRLAAQTWDIALGAKGHMGIALPESVSIEISNITHKATISAAQDATAMGTLLSALCFLVALVAIPEKKKASEEESLISDLVTELVAIDRELTLVTN
ncbi:MAG: hypothetical protein WC813_02210 [Patescibacteria group bacterium]|jgi:hypothetical protein